MRTGLSRFTSCIDSGRTVAMEPVLAVNIQHENAYWDCKLYKGKTVSCHLSGTSFQPSSRRYTLGHMRFLSRGNKCCTKWELYRKKIRLLVKLHLHSANDVNMQYLCIRYPSTFIYLYVPSSWVTYIKNRFHKRSMEGRHTMFVFFPYFYLRFLLVRVDCSEYVPCILDDDKRT